MIEVKKDNIYIIMYHYVREIKNSLHPNIKGLEFKQFKKQINYLVKNFNVLSNDDFAEIICTKKIPKKKSILLTFDDGYIDHWKYVYPFLKEKKITGNFYVPVNVMEKKEILDVNKIHFILEKEENKKNILNLIFNQLNKNLVKKIREVDLNKIKINHRYDDKYTLAIKKILQIILPEDIRKKIINLLFLKIIGIDQENFAKDLYMNSNHLVQMYKDKMIIGSHGCNHFWMNKLNKEKQFKEIKDSINFFKKIEVYNENFSFCYPYGGFNADTIKILKKFNFKYALTTIFGSLNKKNIKDNFLIPRCDVNDFLNFS